MKKEIHKKNLDPDGKDTTEYDAAGQLSDPGTWTPHRVVVVSNEDAGNAKLYSWDRIDGGMWKGTAKVSVFEGSSESDVVQQYQEDRGETLSERSRVVTTYPVDMATIEYADTYLEDEYLYSIKSELGPLSSCESGRACWDFDKEIMDYALNKDMEINNYNYNQYTNQPLAKSWESSVRGGTTYSGGKGSRNCYGGLKAGTYSLGKGWGTVTVSKSSYKGRS